MKMRYVRYLSCFFLFIFHVGFTIADSAVPKNLKAIEEILTGKTWKLGSKGGTYGAPNEEIYDTLCDEQLKITKPNNLEMYCKDNQIPLPAQWKLEFSELGDIVFIISNEKLKKGQRYLLSFIKDGRIILTEIKNGMTDEQLYRIYKEIDPHNP